MTTAGLDLLDAAMPDAATWVQTVVVAVTTAVATAVRFLALKLWVFAPRSLRPASSPPARPARGSESAEVTSVSS